MQTDFIELPEFLRRGGQGGIHHEGRHTGRFDNLTTRELVRDPAVMGLRADNDAVEELCKRLEGNSRRGAL